MKRSIFFLALMFAGCVTSTMTAPDGTRTTTRRPDGKSMVVLGGVVSQIGAAAARAAVEEAIRQQNEQ